MNKAVDDGQDPERIKRPWEEQYRDDDVETMPWFCPDLDHDVAAALDDLNIAPATALDIGAGPGTQSIALAKLGFQVTGTDISPSAVNKAQLRAEKENVVISFVHDDVLQTQLNATFALIIDRGCFHVIEPEQQADYLKSVTHLLDDGGYLFLKTFHKQEDCEQGPPNRFEAADISQIFAADFDLIESRDSAFKGNADFSPKALFCVLRKSGSGA
ncbi:MAG: class I SAM-dependent methyltransferase [Mariprofundus sp.]|nr:class I SAM-dependent methyltransferase [Mariprofundus sp.]